MEKYVESFDKAEIVTLQHSSSPLCLNKLQVQGEVAGQMQFVAMECLISDSLVVGRPLSRRQSSARYRLQRIAINLDARGMTIGLQRSAQRTCSSIDTCVNVIVGSSSIIDAGGGSFSWHPWTHFVCGLPSLQLLSCTRTTFSSSNLD
jgi:hypothetical protein